MRSTTTLYETYTADFSRMMEVLQVAQRLSASMPTMSDAAKQACARAGLDEAVLGNISLMCARIVVDGCSANEEGIDVEHIVRSVWDGADLVMSPKGAGEHKVTFDDCRTVVVEIVRKVLLSEGKRPVVTRYSEERRAYETTFLRLCTINKETGLIQPTPELLNLVWRLGEIDESLPDKIDSLAWYMLKKLKNRNYDQAIRRAEEMRGVLNTVLVETRQLHKACMEDVRSIGSKKIRSFIKGAGALQLGQSEEFTAVQQMLKKIKKDVGTYETHSEAEADPEVAETRAKVERMESILEEVAHRQQPRILAEVNKLREAYRTRSNQVFFKPVPVDMVDWAAVTDFIRASKDTSVVESLFDEMFLPFMSLKTPLFTNLESLFTEQKMESEAADSGDEMSVEFAATSESRLRALDRIYARIRMFRALAAYAVERQGCTLSEFLAAPANARILEETSADNVSPSLLLALLRKGAVPAVAEDAMSGYQDHQELSSLEIDDVSLLAAPDTIPPGKMLAFKSTGTRIERAFRRGNDDVVLDIPDIRITLEDKPSETKEEAL